MFRRQLASLVLAGGLVLGTPAVATLAATVHSVSAMRAHDPCKNPGGDPKCQVPEAPFPLALPAVGLAVFGGFIVMRRRGRTSSRSTSSSS